MSSLKKKSYSFLVNWPYLLLGLLTAIFFWKTFLQGLLPFPGDFIVGIYFPWLDYKWGSIAGIPVKNPIVADVPSFMYPMQVFGVSLMKNLQWPLWNPSILAGAPLLANFQSAPFTFTNVFYLIFRNEYAWSAQIIAAHFFAGLFTYILLKYWKVSKISAILGGIIFSFSGFNGIWSQWNGHVLTASFIPLLIYFVDVFFSRPKVIFGIGISVAFALQIFAGYPQLVLYTALAMAIVWIARFELSKKFFIKSIYVGIFFILGITLSSIQLLPGIELLKLSQWTSEPHPFEWAFLPFSKTITFIAPDFFGNHVTGNYWGPQDYTSNTGFVGVSVLMLSIIGLSLYKRKEVLIGFGLVISSLILSYPTYISILLWENNWFGMRSSSAHRILVLFVLGCAILAAFGLDALKNIKYSKLFSLFSVFIPLTILIIFGWWGYSINNSVALRNLVFPTIIFAFFVGYILLINLGLRSRKIIYFLALLIVCIELSRFFTKFTPYTKKEFFFPTTPVLEFLQEQDKPFRISTGDTMPVNFQMAYGFETLGGYETMRPYTSSQFIAALNTGSSTANPSGRYGIIDNDTSPLLDMVNTKYYLTLKRNSKGAPDPEGTIPEKFQDARFNMVFEDKSVAILTSKNTLPRAFMIYDWEELSDDTEVLERLLSRDFNPVVTALFTEEIPLSKTKGSSITSYVKYEPQVSEINVQSSKPGMLLVSDAFFPGWKASLDGQQTKIYKANYAFRAVVVPQGEHIVRFWYQPESFDRALLLSLFSIAVLLILYLISFFSNVFKPAKKGSK